MNKNKDAQNGIFYQLILKWCTVHLISRLGNRDQPKGTMSKDDLCSVAASIGEIVKVLNYYKMLPLSILNFQGSVILPLEEN